MASTAIYLNFAGNTEEVFEFYKNVFGTEFGSIMRVRDMQMPNVPESAGNYIMHISLPILGGVQLMGTDVVPEVNMGAELVAGNNISIMLSPDSNEEADELFAKLSAGGSDIYPMQMEMWGDYYGSFVDKFGTRWMFDVAKSE